MTPVFVVDAEGNPLLPTNPARARKLLHAGKAAVERVIPFTIRLRRVIEHPVGSLTVGIDDGAKNVGIAVVNEHTREVLLTGTIRLRQDVKKKMTQRAQYRRTRRNRNLRYRSPRFKNRWKGGFSAANHPAKKESILRVIHDLKQFCHITQIVVEQCQFDTSSLVAERKLYGKEYSIPNAKGKHFRAKVLWRDRYICQHCQRTDHLQAHHLQPCSQGGTNSLKNGITLCQSCHASLHRQAWKLTTMPKTLIYPAHLNAGKTYLFYALQKNGVRVRRCYGWMTAYWRQQIGLVKTHCHDAIAMVCRNYSPRQPQQEYVILPKRKKVWEKNPTKTCEEKHGFRHFDVIKAIHRTRGIVIGSVRSLKKTSITLRTSWNDNFTVSYHRSKLLYRFGSVVYIQQTPNTF